MATVTGVVEVIMTNKFNAEKIAMKLEGNDTWYGQSKEWMEVMPNRGDTVEFSTGKGKDGAEGKYIQYLKITDYAAGNSTGMPAAKSGGTWNSNTLGIELGHAANNAVAMLNGYGKPYDLSDVKEVAQQFYMMMKELRSENEDTPKEVQEAPKAASKPAKKAAVIEDFDDSIPF